MQEGDRDMTDKQIIDELVIGGRDLHDIIFGAVVTALFDDGYTVKQLQESISMLAGFAAENRD